MGSSTKGLLAILAFTVAAPVAAQAPLPPTTPRFVEVVRLAQDGFGDSARVIMAKMLAQTSPVDPAYPEALYTAAAVAKTLTETRLHYARIAVDFPSSAWADKAILRLAQLDYGSGNSESAVLRVKRLFTDFPKSQVIPVAALFGARAAFERRDGQLACDWIARGIDMVGNDIELRNQLEFTRQRCTPAELARIAALPNPDSVQPPVAPTVAPPKVTVQQPATSIAKPPVVANAANSPWRIQVAAIADPTSIRRVIGQIEAAGFTAYRVAGPKGLTKLQAGPFATRDAAVAQLAKLQAAVGGAPFITKAP